MGVRLLETALYEDHDHKLEEVEFHLTAPEDIVLNDDGVTWTKIPNMVAVNAVGFSAAGGTLTKTGKSGIFLMNGVSDLSVSVACTVFYGLALNGSIVTVETTEHTFLATSKVANISITALADITLADTIEIWCRGDGTNSVTLTATKLDVTFKG